MTYSRTWRLAVLLAGGMSAAAIADHRDEAASRATYTLSLDALVGPSGTDVALQVSSSAGQLPGEAELVFLWSARRGQIVWARQFRNVALVNGRGVIPGLSIPAHAPVSAMVLAKAARSMKVLWGNTVALDRPDLRISRVDAPAEIRVGQTANIQVLIQEIRGYRGATFDVLLLEGETVLDTVSGASVDPMDSTTAVFSVRFEAEGAHALSARIVNTKPGEYDASNNSASFSIRATSDLLPLSYSLVYQRIEGEFSDNVTMSMKESREAPGYSEVRQTDHESRYEEIGRRETLTYSAFSDRFVSGTIGFSLTIRVDGNRDATIVVSGWTPFSSTGGADWGSNSYKVYDPDTNADIYLESQWSAAKGMSTTLQYSRLAGNYTYHSSGYDRFWSRVSVTDPTTGEVVTTITSGETTWDDGATVVIGSFLDAFQKLQVRAEVAFEGGALGGWTGEHDVVMSAIDRTWDDFASDPNMSMHTWGYERRTFWDAQGNGATAP